MSELMSQRHINGKKKKKKNHILKSSEASIEDSSAIDWRNAYEESFGEFSESGTTLRGFRLREGWSQNELADKIGSLQPNISKMESGERSIGKALAKKLASVFHTNYRIFL